jgi:predicted component of type VI protein secretion system
MAPIASADCAHQPPLVMLAPMSALTLEIIEGPGAGRQVGLAVPCVIGRSPEAELRIDDSQVSRRHASVSPAADGSAIVEDLGSANGTFINHNQVQGPERLDPGDELLIGVSVILLRSSQQVAAQPNATRLVPAALAMAPREPDYVNPNAVAAELAPAAAGIQELERYLDVRVRRRAQLAPLALLLLIALALCIYFATR